MERTRIIVNRSYSGIRPLAEAVTLCGQPAGSVTVYKGRRNTLFYIPPGADAGGGIVNTTGASVNVKAFRIPPFPNGYVYRTLRDSKAARSYKNGLRLLEMGFLTPQPFAYSEVHTGVKLGSKCGIWPKMTRSFYFCEQLPYPNLRDWEGRPDVERLLPALATEIARIHNAGIWFHDFSPGNILVDTDTDGSYRFYYVDLNRMDFGVHDPRRLMQMFKSISWYDEWTERLGRAYATAAGTDPAEGGRTALDAARQWREGHAKKERFKRLIGR